MTAYVVWDIETSTKTEFKRKANPFSADNYVVCQGWHASTLGQDDTDRPQHDYFPTGDSQDARIAACKALPEDWFTKLLPGTKILVGQNIKFDLLYALANPNSHPEQNLQAWMDFVNRGGIVWDVQLAEYLLQGMDRSSHMLSLDELAPQYGGNVKLDEVKALWNAGVDTIDIPEDLLLNYLVGYEGDAGWVEGDIGNTERVFLGQYAKAKKNGQLRSILLNMGSLLYTIEAERNGMHIDQELGEQLAQDLAKKLQAKLDELNSYLPKDLPFEFNWNSGTHKSALIFGGTVAYTGRVLVTGDGGEPVYYQRREQHYLLSDGTTWPADLWKEYTGTSKPLVNASGKNKGEPKTKVVTVPDLERGPKERNDTLGFTFKGFTKPNPKWETERQGVYSTSSDVIEELATRRIPFLTTLGEVAALTKDLGTYFYTTDEKTGKQKGMLTLVQAGSILHHMLNHTSTVTGRLSSSNPNLQNVSSSEKSEVKRVFTSRFPGGRIVSSDFTSLEIYIQAILTGDKQLLQDLRDRIDMHCMRLAAKEHMDYAEVYDLCKGQKLPEWVEKRRGSKSFSFQRSYGAGVAKIASGTGMTEEEVQALVEAEEKRYPGIKKYFDALTSTIRTRRRPTGKTVYHSSIKGLPVQLGRSYVTMPDGKRYCFWESESPEYLARRGQLASFCPTEILNYPVQGTGGEWAKAAMWLTLRAFYHYRNFNGLALIVNQVHDAEYIDSDASVAAKAAALLQVCMEEASTFMEWWFNWDMPISVPSETHEGSSMYEELPMQDPRFNDMVAALRPFIRKKFIGGHVPSFEENA